MHAIVPIVLRINVYIINIDSSANAKNMHYNNKEGTNYNVNEYQSEYEDIKLECNEDNLNYHNVDNTIYVLRKDGHYDIIYKDDNEIKNLYEYS